MAKRPLLRASDDEQIPTVLEWRDEVLRQMLHTAPQPVKSASIDPKRRRGTSAKPRAARRASDSRSDEDRE